MGEVAVEANMEAISKSAKRIVDEIYPQIKELEEKLKNVKDKGEKRKIQDDINSLKNRQANLYRNIVNSLLEVWKKEKLSKIKDKDEDLNKFFCSKGIAEAIACSLGFKTTQLRKIFHQLRSLQYDAKREKLKLYKVKKVVALLAYSAGRKLIDRDFFNLTKGLLEKVEDEEDLNVVIELLEAIVAYRKYYES